MGLNRPASHPRQSHRLELLRKGNAQHAAAAGDAIITSAKSVTPSRTSSVDNPRAWIIGAVEPQGD
jgi:hypothetical protein